MESTTFTDQQTAIINYLEDAYTGARMCDDQETMLRISRALWAFKQDTEEDMDSNITASRNKSCTCDDCVFYDHTDGFCAHYKNVPEVKFFPLDTPSCDSFLRRMPVIRFKTKTARSSYDKPIERNQQ